jgi:hypothetical protein
MDYKQEPILTYISALTSPRYQPCNILRDHKIPYVIWLEDALQCYQVPTGVFDLYLLVSDLDQAAEALLQEGWTMRDPPVAKIGNTRVSTPQRRLFPPTTKSELPGVEFTPGGPPFLPAPSPPTETALLLADDWHLDFQTGTFIPPGSQICIPRLPALLDSLLNHVLDAPLKDTSRSPVPMLIMYLYAYTSTVKSLDLTRELEYHHRQYHIDALSGMFETGTLPWWKHQQKIRDALRRGTWKLSVNSSANVDLDSLDSSK